MTTTLTHPVPSALTVGPPPRATWPWAGVVAGVSGTIATLVLNVPVPTEEQSDAGVDAVYATLDNQTAVRIGASLGFVAVWALVLFAAGFTRHVARRSPEGSLIPSVVRMALTGGIGSLIVGFGLKAAAAGGMPGGIDEAFYTTTDSTVTALISSQMQWVGWQGVAIAMAATAYGTFRHGLTARWIGVVGAIFTLFVATFTVVLCLPYSAGIVAPPFLVLLSIALLTTRKFRS
jgi:hypothetical protein